MNRLLIENRMLTAFLLLAFITVYLLLNSVFPLVQSTSELNLGLFGSFTVPVFAKQIAGVAIIVLNGIGINFIFNHYNFHEKSTYLPALIYVVWMSFFDELHNPSSFILSHTLIILVLFQLFRLNQNEDGRKIVFNAGFFAGLTVCFHLPLVIFLPFLFIMVWSIRPFVLRESLLILTGFCVPLIYAGAAILIFNIPFQQNWQLNVQYLRIEELKLLVHFLFTLIFVIFSAFGIRGKLQKSSIRFRKYARILWLLLFGGICIGLIDVLLSRQVEFFSLIFIPISFFSFFAFIKKPLAAITTILFLILVIASFLKFFL